MTVSILAKHPSNNHCIIGLLYKLLMVAIFYTGLQGCSIPRLAYNNANNFAYWWINDYLNLNNSQVPIVKDQLEVLHKWHRSHELQLYAKLLDQMAAAATKDVTPEQLCEFQSQIPERYLAFAEQAIPAIAIIVPTIDPTQLENISHQFNKNNEKWLQDWPMNKPQKIKERRLEQWIERLNDYYGTLSTQQTNYLRIRIDQSSYDASLVFLEALRRQHEILESLRRFNEHKINQIEIQKELRVLFAQSLHSPNKTYRTQQDNLWKENCQTIAGLHNLSEPTQRVKLRKKIQGLATVTQSLANS